MSLLDAFKPKWQNSNPEKRIEAIDELGSENQDTLERIALSDEDADVRSHAIKKLTVITTLCQIFKSDKEACVRRLAENRYFEMIHKFLKEFREHANSEAIAYIDELKDSHYAEDLIKNLPSSELRLELVKKTSKANLLAIAANKDAKEDIAKAAVERISSESLLEGIAKTSKHSSVRKIASEKLHSIRNADDGGKRAAALLARKRDALIQQAHHLAAQKDPLSVKTQFQDLMKEASILGMGQTQAELDEIFASFNKFCNEADSARIELEKEEARKQNLKVSLLESISELESIIANNQVNENASRIDEIISLWNENKNLMEGPDTKRFNQAFFKIQDLKKKVEEPVKLNINPNEDVRSSLLEKLQALADTETNETTSKHLHSIIREWEKLPLLEGEDTQLQSYNALRNKLGQAISQFNESAQKRFEENSAKLKAIIERVRQFNENEDFKELSLKLRNAYQEWKDIVGEQKFKYHDLWFEYKAATERFQELRQWQTWHNENDRTSILEEMEALAKEPASQEVLSKLHEFSNKWKNIGPISPTKFNEFRDKFQTLFEQIKQNCAPFIEERLAERQKNLTEKESLCQKAEELVSNATINSKDKFKAIQEIQESWKNIGMVPKENLPALMERFKNVINAFYAQHKENLKQEDSVRESNYAKKIALCEEAENLKDSTDWNATSKKMKQLQDSWKATGPAPKSKSEEVWTRFRTACDSFFEKKRGHFEEIDAEKQENQIKKIALCEKLEAMDLTVVNEDSIKEVNDIQNEWKSIGMIPKESVETINERYNAIINQFIHRQAESDETLRQQLEESKVKKQAIIEKIRQFAESAGSNQLADAVRELQKDWREIGSCGIDDLILYKTFREVCDDFFSRRRDQLDIQEQARQNNLQKKLLLCDQAEDLLNDLNEQTVVAAMNKVKHLRRLWKEVGAVPRNQSDKIWNRFNTACDKVFAFGRKDEPKTELAPAADNEDA